MDLILTAVNITPTQIKKTVSFISAVYLMSTNDDEHDQNNGSNCLICLSYLSMMYDVLCVSHQSTISHAAYY